MRRGLAFTSYSFSSRPLYENQYYYSQAPPLFGHPTPPLHPPHYCTKQCSPPTILYCNACHTILVMAISCKGQGGEGGGGEVDGSGGGGGGGRGIVGGGGGGEGGGKDGGFGGGGCISGCCGEGGGGDGGGAPDLEKQMRAYEARWNLG